MPAKIDAHLARCHLLWRKKHLHFGEPIFCEMEKREAQLGGIIAVIGAIFSFLAIPQASSLICKVSGFLCPAIQAEDISIRFFVKEQNSGCSGWSPLPPPGGCGDSLEHLRLREPDQNDRIYSHRFAAVEARSLYLDLSFRHQSVRKASDFTIKPVCFAVDANSKSPISCKLLNFTLDANDGRNVLDPETNVFQKTAVLELSDGGAANPPGNYEIIIEIGGEGEAIAFKTVTRQLDLI